MKLTKPHAAVMYAMALSPTEEGCMIWRGAKDQDGYGRLNVGKKQYRAHRLIYEIENDLDGIPRSQCVLHRCDNRACFRPSHLFLGTQADNMKDMISKGRGWWQKKRGTKTLT